MTRIRLIIADDEAPDLKMPEPFVRTVDLVGNSYSYDANGNMTQRNAEGRSCTFVYDTENRLVSVTGAPTANFYYDADGKQVKTVVDGVTTYYACPEPVEGSAITTKSRTRLSPSTISLDPRA